MASRELQPGDRLGVYTIEAIVGRGGSAIVYRAHDPRFGEPVAIKMLVDHLAGDVEAVERFSGEARSLRAIDNDAVVSVYDIAQTDNGVPYMVLGLADRGTLEDRLALGRPASAAELRTLLAFFERALGALHERGLVHRDVKPSNVLLATAVVGSGIATPRPATFGLLRDDDRLLLADLGLVKDTTVGRALTRGAGTHSYAAPEQRAVVSQVTNRTDLYAASAVIAEATIGRIRGTNESFEDVVAEISDSGRPAFAEALRAGFAEEPDNRPSDVGVWARQLGAALAETDPEGLGETASGGSLAGSEDNRRGALGRSQAGKALVVLVMVAALIGASVLWLNSPTEDASSVTTGPAPESTVQPTATNSAPDTPDIGGPTVTPTPDPTAALEPSAVEPAPTDEVLSASETSPSATIATSPTESPSATATASPTASPTPTPTLTPTPSPTPIPTPTATAATLDIRDVDCATVGGTTVAGPVPGLTVVNTTATTATLSWTARDTPLSIFIGPQYLDNISAGANLYVAEGIALGQANIISIADHSTTVAELVGNASIVCAVSEAAFPGPPAAGPLMATDLVATSVTATTATLEWTPAAGGGRYTMWAGELVPGQRYPRLNNTGSGGSPAGSSSFEFTELPPGSQVVIGMRTIIEPNQSNLAWITVDTPSG